MTTYQARKNKEGLKTLFQAAVFYTLPMLALGGIIHFLLLIASKIYGN